MATKQNPFQAYADRLAQSTPETNRLIGDGEAWEESQRLRLQSATRDRYIAERGRRYSDCTFETFDAYDDAQKSALKQIREFASNIRKHVDDGDGLVFAGPSGTGKDHLLTACVFSAISAGVENIKWTSGPRLFSELRSSISENSPERRVLQPLISADVLVFSDLAMGGLTEYQADIVYQIVDRRYSNRRPTWISVNARTREDFEASTSVQIVDRLIHAALYVPFDWPSYRKLKDG